MINPIKKYKEKKEKEKAEQERLKREEEERKAREEAERKALEKKKEKQFIIMIVLLAVITSIFVIAGVLFENNSNKDKIKSPASSEECIDMFYTDVEYMFKNAGFSNVITQPMNDLISSNTSDKNTVDNITIDGHKGDFTTDTYLNPDTRIVIYYHSFTVTETTTKKEIQTTQTITEQTTITTTEATTFKTKKKDETTTKKDESNINSNKSEAHEYVLNTNSKVFHIPGCNRGPKPDSKNIDYVNATKEELISQGYKPCKVCNP